VQVSQLGDEAGLIKARIRLTGLAKK